MHEVLLAVIRAARKHLAWLEQHARSQPQHAAQAGELRYAAALVRNVLAPFLEGSGSNSFVRNLVHAVVELHGTGEPEITRDNWQTLDAAVRAAHRRPELRK